MVVDQLQVRLPFEWSEFPEFRVSDFGTVKCVGSPRVMAPTRKGHVVLNVCLFVSVHAQVCCTIKVWACMAVRTRELYCSA